MFDVYVDGATGTSREAVRELAGAMAARYGLPAAELEARLTRGRFRVKSAVDRGTAEAYLRDLAAIGARVRIEPAGEPPGPGGEPARTALPPQPEARTRAVVAAATAGGAPRAVIAAATAGGAADDVVPAAAGGAAADALAAAVAAGGATRRGRRCRRNRRRGR